MDKKTLKVISFFVAVALVIFIIVFADLLNGNPISKQLAINSANEHFIKNYSQTDFILHELEYRIEYSQYYAQISSPSSIDTTFHLVISKSGNIKRDSYESAVLSGDITWLRCDEGYNKLVKDVFQSPDFPYDSTINSGAIPFYDTTKGIDMSILELDQDFDYEVIGSKYGEVFFRTTSDEITVEKASEILLGLVKYFDDNEVYFNNIHFYLSEPDDYSEIIQLDNFPYTDIYEDGLVVRVQNHISSKKEH